MWRLAHRKMCVKRGLGFVERLGSSYFEIWLLAYCTFGYFSWRCFVLDAFLSFAAVGLGH